MRLVVQRVKYCKIHIDAKMFSSINKGLLCYIGISKDDTIDDAKWLIDKAIGLRIFEHNGKMNLSVKDIDGELMLVSQFTLLGDVRKGKRPSFTDAAPIEMGKQLYESTVEYAQLVYDKHKIKTGLFQAMMDVEYINDGPVTILIDSKKKF